MKIGIICYPSIGGSGLVATELGTSLAKRGHEVHFISHSVPFKLSRFEKNVHFHSVDPINYPLFNQTLYTFSLTAKIIDVVKDYHLDLVHAHYSIPHSLCAHLAREVCQEDFKIVTTLHGTDVTIVGQNEPLFTLNKFGIEQSDKVTTVSNFQKEHTIREFAITKEIEVIYNFVDSDVFKPAKSCSRSDLAAADEKIIMHISNFRYPKNPAGIIKTFNKVQAEISARLILIGDGPGVGEIKSLCKEFDICERVSFLGKIDNVETIIPMADCIFQPSYMESFGMVLLEAMACEIPTVSSDVNGIPEVISHGETGLMAAPDDLDTLAEYLIRICTSTALARQFGKNGRRRAISNFNQEEMVGRYIQCYETMLNA